MTESLETQRALDDRYGRSRQRGFDRRFAWAAGAVIVLAGVVWMAFVGVRASSGVDFQDIGRTIVSDHEVEARFSVTAPPNAAVACAVEALSSSKGTVGWKVVELPVTDEHTHKVTTSVVTTSRASTGSVSSCWVLEGDD